MTVNMAYMYMQNPDEQYQKDEARQYGETQGDVPGGYYTKAREETEPQEYITADRAAQRNTGPSKGNKREYEDSGPYGTLFMHANIYL
jgi:hypothetical protein